MELPYKKMILFFINGVTKAQGFKDMTAVNAHISIAFLGLQHPEMFLTWEGVSFKNWCLQLLRSSWKDVTEFG